MVEKALEKISLLERLKSQASGQDIVEYAVRALNSDADRRQFFQEYIASITPSNFRGPVEIIRKQAINKILGAVPENRYGSFESWSRVLNPNLHSRQGS
jgi:hypothetical protein